MHDDRADHRRRRHGTDRLRLQSRSSQPLAAATGSSSIRRRRPRASSPTTGPGSRRSLPRCNCIPRTPSTEGRRPHRGSSLSHLRVALIQTDARAASDGRPLSRPERGLNKPAPWTLSVSVGPGSARGPMRGGPTAADDPPRRCPMSASRRGFGSRSRHGRARPRHRLRLRRHELPDVAVVPAGEAPAPTTAAGPAGSEGGDLVIVGRIVTMDEPPMAEALLIEDGPRDLRRHAGRGAWRWPARRCRSSTSAANVAYPGFIDAHAHWIGDRDYYGIDSPAAAMDAALSRGWTSISEQWVNQERLDELEALAADDALPLRVDAYLALNFDTRVLRRLVHVARARACRRPPPRPGAEDPSRRRRGQRSCNWEPADLTATIGRAERGRLAGIGPRHELRGPGAGPRRLRGGARSDRAEPAPPPDRARHPGDATSSWPAWSPWTSPR